MILDPIYQLVSSQAGSFDTDIDILYDILCQMAHLIRCQILDRIDTDAVVHTLLKYGTAPHGKRKHILRFEKYRLYFKFGLRIQLNYIFPHHY